MTTIYHFPSPHWFPTIQRNYFDDSFDRTIAFYQWANSYQPQLREKAMGYFSPHEPTREQAEEYKKCLSACGNNFEKLMMASYVASRYLMKPAILHFGGKEPVRLHHIEEVIERYDSWLDEQLAIPAYRRNRKQKKRRQNPAP